MILPLDLPMSRKQGPWLSHPAESRQDSDGGNPWRNRGMFPRAGPPGSDGRART